MTGPAPDAVAAGTPAPAPVAVRLRRLGPPVAAAPARSAGRGDLSTPALVVDERLLLAGRVPGADEPAALLTQHAATTSETAGR